MQGGKPKLVILELVTLPVSISSSRVEPRLSLCVKDTGGLCNFTDVDERGVLRPV